MKVDRGLIEDVCKSKPSVLMNIAHVICWVFAVLLVLIGFIPTDPSWVAFVFMIAGIALGFLAYWLGRRVNVEYEYSYFDGEIHFAAVYNKEARKELQTVRLDEMEAGGAINSYRLENYRNKDKTLKTADYSSHVTEQPDKRFVLYFSNQRVVFEPGQEMVDAISEKYSHKFYKE